MIEIWSNPACSKCRTAVSELDASGKEYVVRHYLDTPPTVPELEDLLARLGLEPWDLARTADAPRLGVELPAREQALRHTWLELMSDHPVLIQRPIITASDGTTVVGRDGASVARVIEAV